MSLTGACCLVGLWGRRVEQNAHTLTHTHSPGACLSVHLPTANMRLSTGHGNNTPLPTVITEMTAFGPLLGLTLPPNLWRISKEMQLSSASESLICSKRWALLICICRLALFFEMAALQHRSSEWQWLVQTELLILRGSKGCVTEAYSMSSTCMHVSAQGSTVTCAERCRMHVDCIYGVIHFLNCWINLHF